MKINGHFPTLPYQWYVEPEYLEIEKRAVFSAAPDYVGCVPLVPSHGSFHTVPQHDHAEILVRDKDQVRLISNVCLHRGMLLKEGRGEEKVIVCPMHLWSYNLQGELLKAPRYPETPCQHLPSRPLQDWNGILFAGTRDVARELEILGDRPSLDIRHYVFTRSEEEEQPVNWKIPIEVLLDNYHAPVIHPGFTRYAASTTWFQNEGGYDSERLMFQEMKPNPDFSRNPASQTFERWQQAILQLTEGKLPPFGAIVVLYYPNIIIEWWPFTFIVTTYIPRTPDKTLMTREFFYDPQALESMPEFPDLTQAAWYETQRADDVAHEALQKGRTQLQRWQPDAPNGYELYQSPMENSVQLFHAVLWREIGSHLD